VHQDAANSVGFSSAFEALLQNAQGLCRFTVIDELGCVMQDQDRTISGSNAIVGAWKCPANIGTSLTLRFERKR